MIDLTHQHVGVPRESLPDDRIANDILQGADQIAQFLFGDPAARRRIYDLAESGVLPVFRLGRIICARRTTLHAWIDRQEGSGAPERPSREAS